MEDIRGNLEKFIIANYKKIDLSRVEVAIEHETIRTIDEKISPKNHPTIFEPKSEHKYITTDFSESQMELITPVYCSSEELYNFSNTLYDIASMAIDEDEYLWPYSMPMKISSDDEIREAIFPNDEYGKQAIEYRKHLTSKYGKRKQTISGIHFNFSLCDDFLKKFIQNGMSKNDIYLKIIRNYKKYKFLTTALIGASPICHNCFEKTGKMVSIRNSEYGYRNLVDLNIDYNSVESFIESVNKNIENGNILNERELYETIRIKTKSKNVLNDLSDHGIKYVEIRNIDINPYEKGGISLKQIELIKYIIFYCLIKEENSFEVMGNELNDFVARTFDFDTKIPIVGGKTINKLLKEVLTDMLITFKNINVNVDILEEYINYVEKGDLLYKKVYYDIEKEGYTEFFKRKALEYKKEAFDNRFRLYGFEEMELSTQILMKESIKNSVEVDIIDIFDNFIKLKKGENSQYIKQATKTSLDNYATVCAMENKVVTKKILSEKGIRVPEGKDFIDFDSAFNYAKKINKSFVIKPKSTNFGLGINIFKERALDEDIKKAVEIAFSHDKTIIVEEYVSGEEYRFLVIGDRAVGVLNRVPANVVGNGKHTISELVEEKNRNSLRGKGYKTPLEKIDIDENAEIFLKSQGLDKNYIPKDNQKIYLRQNSNVSTGGDSIDHTDSVNEKFKQIAVEASKAIGASICGVDIIIDDYTDIESEYSIIELNFNPAIHIHSYPYKGVERNIAIEILKLLELV